MIIEQTITIVLDPNTEYNTIQQYEQDEGWHEVGFSTTAVVYEKKSPPVYMQGRYIPSDVS